MGGVVEVEVEVEVEVPGDLGSALERLASCERAEKLWVTRDGDGVMVAEVVEFGRKLIGRWKVGEPFPRIRLWRAGSVVSLPCWDI